jgi:hypothetical protein
VAKTKAVKKQVVPAKPPVAKPPVNGDSKIINVIAKENPKRGASRERFSLYRSGESHRAVHRAIGQGGQSCQARTC